METKSLASEATIHQHMTLGLGVISSALAGIFRVYKIETSTQHYKHMQNA